MLQKEWEWLGINYKVKGVKPRGRQQTWNKVLNKCVSKTQYLTYMGEQISVLEIRKGGGATAPWLAFLENSHWADVKLWLTCNAATYCFRDMCSQMAKISYLGDPLWAPPPKGEKICLGPICTLYHHAKFHADRCHCREISVIIIIISTTMFMVPSSWQSHCESSPSSFDECRMAPSGRRPKTKPDDLGWVRLYRLPETTPTIAIYYYSARKLILILPSHRG